MSEVYLMYGLAAVFMAVYIVGSITNKKTAIKYSKMIKEAASPFCSFVGFKKFGRGFKALCQLKDAKPFSRIDITLSLVWRENAMYYPLSLITREYDRIFLWGLLKSKAPFNLSIVRRDNRRVLRQLEGKGLSKVELGNLNFIAFTDDLSKTKKVIREIYNYLVRIEGSIMLVSINRESEWVKLIGFMSSESIKPIFDLLIGFGRVVDEFI